MRTATMRSLLAHKLRLGLTVLSVTLGVALVAGTFVLTGAMAAERAGPPAAAQADVVVRGEPLAALQGVAPEREPPRRPVPAALADQLGGVDGVAAVRGAVRGPVTILGADGAPAGSGDAAATGISVTTVPGLAPQVRLADGQLPAAAGEGRQGAVVDAATARALDLTIGEPVRVAGADGRALAFTVTGLLRPGTLPGRVAGFDLPTAQRLLGRVDQLDELQVAAAPGTDPETLRKRVPAAVGGGYDIHTGAAVERERQAARAASVRTISQTMIWFVIVALLIGGFLVANAFSIRIAQRTRELALLRCLGATTAQVRNAVLLEALVVGAVASALGTLLGPLVAAGLARQFSRLGGGLDAGTGLGDLLNVTPLTVLGPIAVGVLVTVAAAALPARRATAVPPLTAMRTDGAGVAVERVSPARVVSGLIVTGAGGAVLAAGLARFEGALVGGGGLLFLIGMAILAVPVARPLARLIGTPVAWLGGVPGRLSRANAMRSPRRTAATAAALMIGLAMIVTLTVIAASQKATATAAIRMLEADYQVAAGSQPAGADPFGTPDGPVVSRTLIDDLAGRPEVTAVTGRWTLAATLPAPPGAGASTGDPLQVPVDAVVRPADYQHVAGLQVTAGSMGADGVAVSGAVAGSRGLSPGSSLRLDIPGAEPVVLPVTAVFDDARGHASPLVVALDHVAGAVPDRGVPVVYVETGGGPGPAAAAALESATRAYPAVAVRDEAAQRERTEQQVNQVLYLMYALLGLAVVIGLLGIVNTLALSMVDRVRELGLLRAVGMDRRQVRAMIRGEAVIIALLGTLLGLAVGMLFGWAVASRLIRLPVFAVPAAQLAALVAAAAAASVVAAALPGRWAARVDVLRATAAE